MKRKVTLEEIALEEVTEARTCTMCDKPAMYTIIHSRKLRLDGYHTYCCADHLVDVIDLEAETYRNQYGDYCNELELDNALGYASNICPPYIVIPGVIVPKEDQSDVKGFYRSPLLRVVG